MAQEAKQENEMDGMEQRGQDMRLLEAMLFATAEPLSVQAMHERLPEGTDVGGLLMALQKKYEKAGVHLHEMNGAWAFRTAVDLSDALSLQKEVQRKLSRAAMETLAIVAYHQPVTRAEIENIRGVATSKGTLDVLMEANWVKPGRRRESPGRPLTWVTTSGFMDHFGLESMNDLPGMDDLKSSGLLDRRPAIDTVKMTGELFGEEEEQLEEDLSYEHSHDSAAGDSAKEALETGSEMNDTEDEIDQSHEEEERS